MNKNQPLLDHISPTGIETITLNTQEINKILGLKLPKTALNYRMFWENSKNRTRVQSLLGLSSSYTCKVKLKERVVIFQKSTSSKDYALV
jgi:hypothetical protein